MLTNDDINKLKQIFATKDDLETLHKNIIKDMTSLFEDSLLPLLNEHEKRLDRLEKHVGGFPQI